MIVQNVVCVTVFIIIFLVVCACHLPFAIVRVCVNKCVRLCFDMDVTSVIQKLKYTVPVTGDPVTGDRCCTAASYFINVQS